MKTAPLDGHPSVGQPCMSGVPYKAQIYWTRELRTDYSIGRNSATNTSNPFGDGCGLRDREMGRKEVLRRGLGDCAQRHQPVAAASPFPNHTQAVPSPTARSSAIPSSHPHWALVLPGPGRVARPLGLDPETLTREPPEGPKGEAGRAYNLGCCWICSRADSRPTRTQTATALLPALSPACLLSNVAAAQPSAIFTTKAET